MRFGMSGSHSGNFQTFASGLPIRPRRLHTNRPRRSRSRVAFAALVRSISPALAMVLCDSANGWLVLGKWSHMISQTWACIGVRSRRTIANARCRSCFHADLPREGVSMPTAAVEFVGSCFGWAGLDTPRLRRDSRFRSTAHRLPLAALSQRANHRAQHRA